MGSATPVGAGSAFSRRRFLERSAVLGAAAALSQVPGLLRIRGWYDPVYAQDPDLVRDTLNGLVALLFPGDDAYSVAQGDATDGPGGLAADTTTLLIDSLDNFLPAPDFPGAPSDDAVPLSGAIANLLNVLAVQVNPVAAGGTFPSPFARLSLAEKAEVFRILEEDAGLPDGELPQPFTQGTGNFRFVAGILPGFVAFLGFTEWHQFDPAARTLRGRPVGWEHSGYQPGRVAPVEGWDELLGFWQGRTAADA